jgi:hypothetical protein
VLPELVLPELVLPELVLPELVLPELVPPELVPPAPSPPVILVLVQAEKTSKPQPTNDVFNEINPIRVVMASCGDVCRVVSSLPQTLKWGHTGSKKDRFSPTLAILLSRAYLWPSVAAAGNLCARVNGSGRFL